MPEGETQSGPRFCRQCGSVVPEGTTLCPRCGQRWYMDRTEQQGVDLWQKIIEKRAASGLGESAQAPEQKQYRCPNCMAVLKSAAPVCPRCGKSTAQPTIVPAEAQTGKAAAVPADKFSFPEAARGLASIKGATKRASGLKSKRRLRKIDTIIIAAIVVVIAVVAFALAFQYGLLASPLSFLSSSKPAAQQQPAAPVSAKPEISDVQVSDVTSGSAVIAWTTDKPAWGKIMYGKTQSYEASMLAEFQQDSQKLVLTGLEPGTSYHFAVLKTDGRGQEISRSSDSQFTTLPAGDTKRPVITQFKVIPGDIGAVVQWVTDEPATSQVMFGSDQSTTNASGPDTRLTTNHSVRLSSLDANNSYYYRIKSADAAGNETISDPPGMFTTLITVPVGSRIGERAADFTLPVFRTQDSISLRSYRGQKVLLTFWAVYCPECDRELALLQSLKDRNPSGVQIVAVFLESKLDDIDKTIAKYKADSGALTVPVVVDMYKTTAHLYNVDKLPCTFYIDGDLIIRDIDFGSFNINQVEQKLKDL
jgi:peroxiredoxin/RNA polymerase subunit RPABC4/transcription elongation factor Spt4